MNQNWCADTPYIQMFHIFTRQIITYYIKPCSLEEYLLSFQPYITCHTPFHFIFGQKPIRRCGLRFKAFCYNSVSCSLSLHLEMLTTHFFNIVTVTSISFCGFLIDISTNFLNLSWWPFFVSVNICSHDFLIITSTLWSQFSLSHIFWVHTWVLKTLIYGSFLKKKHL